MNTFFGGQIKPEHRGDLAAVVNREQRGSMSPVYGVFLYPVSSAEFVHLTGVMAVNNPIERAYIGISAEAGNRIAAEVNGRRADKTDLTTIDKLFVVTYFLAECSDRS
ncbi:hypothetical protein HYV82_05520 [Candidatus Woesearchaeota archaeon]|nr:hypothetical protein [Candidatus Woesearchaeota archaeon]